MLTLTPTFVEIESSDTGSLLDRARAGETEAFSEICRLHETRLLRQAMTLCGNPALAEDLAQDTLVEAWKYLHRYDGRCQFFTWLCAILLNRFRNAVRQKRPVLLSTLSRNERDQLEDRVSNQPDDGVLPDEQTQLRERAALVLACLRTLPLKQQQVVYLRFYVDQSLEGIASALGCSVGTVKSRLFHALEKLRAMKQLSAELPNPKIEMSTL